MKNLNIASNNHLLRQHKQTSIFEIGLLIWKEEKKILYGPLFFNVRKLITLQFYKFKTFINLRINMKNICSILRASISF